MYIMVGTTEADKSLSHSVLILEVQASCNIHYEWIAIAEALSILQHCIMVYTTQNNV